MSRKRRRQARIDGTAERVIPTPKPREPYKGTSISKEKHDKLKRKFERDARMRAGPVTKRKGRIRFRSAGGSSAYRPGHGTHS